jgi:hypothetical protein
VLCCGLEKNGMVRAWHGRGMASVNQTRPHCVNPPLETVYWPLQANVYSKAIRCKEKATHVKVKVTVAGKLM